MSADNKTDALREALAWALTQLPEPIWPGSYKDRFEAARAVLAADHFEDVLGMVETARVASNWNTREALAATIRARGEK